MHVHRLGLALAVLTACGPDGRADATDTSPTTQPGTTAPTSTSSSSGDVAPTTTGDASTTTTTTGTTDATGTTAVTGTTDVDTTTTTEPVDPSTTTTVGPKLDLPPEMPIPVKDIPGLMSITFYESTSGVMQYTFLIDGPELNNLLPDPLSNANRDIEGTSVEFYDVYYSDVDGVFDPLGSYLTIAGSFGAKLPAGGGLNLAEISLNFDDNVFEFGSFLASYVGLGDNYIMGSEPNAIDNNLDTHTTMGNTVDTPGQRLRVTLGFKSSLMPG
ncbi:hypothetical protein [Nannocystis punicea]|uniref:Uncharacterized protein n=1 Tax=Nannocystis punicea TaxID=2995304 RepID=A0ABY7GYB2_9BACT|nr:hypothetical protein [Nannocystis poenicansa]WAS91962.1 hypothetical protein O0S08_37755 [Nannocystis poenicansa]